MDFDRDRAKKVIREIYEEKIEPEAILEFYSEQDYLQQLWPEEIEKLAGDWILQNFDISDFINKEKIKEYTVFVSNELNDLQFFIEE